MMGHLLTVLYALGFILLAKFFPIPTPSWSAQRITTWLVHHRTAYEFGCMLMLICGGLLGPWGSSLAMWCRKTEGKYPMMFVTQLVSLAASVALFVLIPIFWALAAFRAGQISPQITQTVFDLGWFTFLWAGPAFYLWALGFGCGILWNPPEHQLFPRWVGWFTVANVLCWAMGLIFVFWHRGPAAYSGALPTWIALASFFAWVEVLCFYGWRAIKRQEEISRADPSEGIYEPHRGPLLAADEEPLNGSAPERRVPVGSR